MEKEMVAHQPKLSLVVVAQDIASGLQAFENRKAELITLKAEVEGLKIQSLEDKAGIKQVTEARKKLKAARVEIEKEGKSMRDPLTAISKTISAKENELVQIIEPTEKLLLQQEKWVKDEEIRVANEERRKEDERIQNRINRMSFYGYEIDFNMLKALSDEDFDKIVDNARREFEKEEAAKAEKARQEQAQREQDDRDRAELKALREKQEAADKILKEREEEVARKEKFIKQHEEEERILAEKRKEKEMKDPRFELRKDQLLRMGFTTYGIAAYPDFSLKDTWSTYWEQVYNMGDAEWPEYIKDIEGAIQRRKDKMAEEEKNQVEAIKAALKKAEAEGIGKSRRGMLQSINGEAGTSDFELGSIPEEQWSRDFAFAKNIHEKKQKEIEAQQESDRLATASDKEKLERIVEQFQSIAFPEVKSVKAKKLVSEVKDMQAKIIAHIKTKS